MRKKIIFINPPYERIARGYDFLRHITNRSPSLGLLHLAAEVRGSGYQPSIVESDIFDLTVDEVADRVIEEKPAYVGITLFTVGVWGAAAIARKIKKALPDTVIIVGGPHISSMGPETIQRFPEFDMAVEGEGERPLMDLLSALESKRSLSSVPSLIYREGENVLTTPALPVNKVLDELP
ncbi:MAG: cobalamin-dependent protein, partial [Gammaproteobacteria bacterium]